MCQICLFAAPLTVLSALHTTQFSCYGGILIDKLERNHDQCVPVTTEWRILRLRVDERPSVWRVAANILNRQSRTADKGWFSRDQCIPVTTEWHVLRLRVEERPLVWRVAANTLNRQLRTADKG